MSEPVSHGPSHEGAAGRVALALTLGAALAAAAYPLAYIDRFAGDATIHLQYARNAAAGRFFEFNPGETSPGVTSPGYMLLLAGLFRVLPESAIPIVVKAIAVTTWFASLGLVLYLARRMCRGTALAATMAIALMPGAVMNATVGMENGPFATLILGWFALALRWRWWRVEASWRQETVLGVVLGLLCWLRPEGLVLSAVLMAHRVARERRRGRLARAVAASVPAVAAVSVLGGALALFHHAWTGWWVPASGVSRIVMSWRDSIAIGPVVISPVFMTRLAAYAPLTLAFLAGHMALARRWGPFAPAADGDERRAMAGATLAVFWTFFVVYTAIGGAQLARYTIFLMCLVAPVAAVGTAWLWNEWPAVAPTALRRFRTLAFVAGACSLAGVYAAETIIRMQSHGDNSLRYLQEASDRRTEVSDRVLKDLGANLPIPVSLALTEVEVRYWLDDRFIVRSLDGRTDPVLLQYVSRDAIDHLGYLKARHVDVLIDLPNYNRDRRAWALDRLRDLTPGASIERDGLKLTRLPFGGVRVEPIAASR